MLIEAPKWWWIVEGEGRLPARLLPSWPFLRLAEVAYKCAIVRRNRAYDTRERAGQVFDPPIPTISVGNITVGGSGKTPVAIWLARFLQQRGLKPAVIARGYGAKGASYGRSNEDTGGQAASGTQSSDLLLNDEMLLASRKCPYAAVLANPDRAAAIREAVDQHGAQVAVLDDAFQHRKVRRDLNIVLVDATRGFGNGHMLPAGPLREPVQSLRRADLVLLTRTEQVQPARVDALVRKIVSYAGKDLPVGRIAFEPAGVTDLQFAPVGVPEGPGGAFAGIGNFDAFSQTCRQRGFDVVADMPLADHVYYDDALCSRIAEWARARDLRWLVTTEKDAVKLSQLSRQWPIPVRVLGIEAVPDEQTRALLEQAVLGCLGRSGRRG